MQRADFVCEVEIIDPDTHLPVEVSIYKDRDSKALFGIDGSYILTLSDNEPVSSPFNGDDIELIESEKKPYIPVLSTNG